MDRNYKIDNLRAIAIISVVLGHSIILYSSTWTIYESARSCVFLDYLYRIINIYQMPLFFSISGYLLFKSNQLKPFFLFVKSKIKRLLIPFLIIGTLYMIPLKLLLNHPQYENITFINAIIRLLIGKESGHLWFLPTLFFIFIISYFILLLSKKYSIVLPICFFFSLILSLVNSIIPNIGIPFQSNIVSNFWSFLLGAVLNRYHLIEKFSKIKPLFIIASLISIIIILLIKRFTIISSIITVIALYFIVPNCNYKPLQKISSNSFGIYLFHSPLIYITFTFLLNANPLIVCFINFVLFGTVAFLLTELINNTKLNFIIGSQKTTHPT